MIAQRFQSLGWVAGIATAATGLYLISLQVAAERAKLETVERRITATQRDMRRLQTELGTRASMRQLEKWNGETLSLSAPTAAQFIHSEAQLAALTTSPGLTGSNTPPAFRNAAVEPGPAPQRTDTVAPGLVRAAFIKSAKTDQPQRVAMVERNVIARATLNAIVHEAAQEGSKRP